MIARGRTKKQAISYWDRKQAEQTTPSEQIQTTNAPAVIPKEFQETTMDDLTDVRVNLLQPDSNRVLLQGSKLDDPLKVKGFRQIGDGTPEMKPERFTFISKHGRPSMNPASIEKMTYGVIVLVVALLAYLSQDFVGSIFSMSGLGLVVGMAVHGTYGPERVLPEDVDFVWYDNLNLGWTAALVDGTNNVFSFSMPYPAGMNLFEETIDLYRNDLINLAGIDLNGLVFRGTDWYFSMLDKEFDNDWVGIANVANTEQLKSQFDGPIYLGDHWAHLTGAARSLPSDAIPINTSTRIVHYYPPVKKLKLVTPMFVQVKGWTWTVTLATGAVAPTADYALQTTFAFRMFFKVRRLTADERSVRSDQLRWQLINS